MKNSPRKFVSGECQGLRVVKLGGSLLDLPALPHRLLATLNAWPPARNVIVVGGGKAADLIREWDNQFQLGDHRSHRMAVFAMTWNARQLFRNEPDFELIADLNAFQSSEGCHRTGVVLAEPFLNSIVQQNAAPGVAESWDVTSDSLAAYMAAVMNADQLVLLKSTDWNQSPQPSDGNQADGNQVKTDIGANNDANNHRLLQDISEQETIRHLVERGLVDPCFSKYAAAVPEILWCHFSAADNLAADDHAAD